MGGRGKEKREREREERQRAKRALVSEVAAGCPCPGWAVPCPWAWLRRPRAAGHRVRGRGRSFRSLGRVAVRITVVGWLGGRQAWTLLAQTGTGEQEPERAAEPKCRAPKASSKSLQKGKEARDRTGPRAWGFSYVLCPWLLPKSAC